jgi:hypothetical protein
MKPSDRELEHDIIFQEIKKDHEKYGDINLPRVKAELEKKSIHLVNSLLESRRDAYLAYVKNNSSRI